MPRSYWYHSLAAVSLAVLAPLIKERGATIHAMPLPTEAGIETAMAVLLLFALFLCMARLSIRIATHFKATAFIPIYLMALSGDFWDLALRAQGTALSIVLLLLAALFLIDGRDSASYMIASLLFLAGGAWLAPVLVSALPAFFLLLPGGRMQRLALAALPLGAASLRMLSLAGAGETPWVGGSLWSYGPGQFQPFPWSTPFFWVLAGVAPFALFALAAITLETLPYSSQTRLLRWLLLGSLPLILVPLLALQGDTMRAILAWGTVTWTIFAGRGLDMAIHMGGGESSISWSLAAVTLYLLPALVLLAI